MSPPARQERSLVGRAAARSGVMNRAVAEAESGVFQSASAGPDAPRQRAGIRHRSLGQIVPNWWDWEPKLSR